MQGTEKYKKDKERYRIYMFKYTVLNNLGLSLRAAAIILTRAGFRASTSAFLEKRQKATKQRRNECM